MKEVMLSRFICWKTPFPILVIAIIPVIMTLKKCSAADCVHSVQYADVSMFKFPRDLERLDSDSDILRDLIP